MISLGDDHYPPLLAKIHDPPPQLWVNGSFDLAATCVAIVGTRASTRYGEEVARGLAKELAQRGAWIVSGMARGIDAAAHRGALEAGGRTIAVLGCGVDVVYPREHRELAEQIARSGAIVSEFPPGHPPEKFTFVQRNRVIAGLSVVTVVVESPLDGGAMITADFACEQGRTVAAVPGRVDQPNSAGCHQLIREGASLVTCADDLFAELGFAVVAAASGLPGPPAALRRSPTSGDEQFLLAALSNGDRLPLDALIVRSGLPTARANATVLMLELKGAITKRSDGLYEA